MTQDEVFTAWEGLLTDKGYRWVHFDGLNRYYLHHEQQALEHFFRSGPNLFDGFQLSGTANNPFCTYVEQRVSNEHLVRLESLKHENAQLLLAETEYSASLDSERKLARTLREDLQAERTANLQNQNAAKGLLLQQEQRSQEEVKTLLMQLARNEQIKAEELERLRNQGRAGELALAQEHAMSLREMSEASAEVQRSLKRDYTIREQALLDELAQARQQMSALDDSSRRELQALQTRIDQIHRVLDEAVADFQLRERALVESAKTEAKDYQSRIDSLLIQKAEAEQRQQKHQIEYRESENALRRELAETKNESHQIELTLIESAKTEAREYQSRIDSLHSQQTGAELRHQQQLAAAREIEEALRKELSQKVLDAVSLANELARLQQTISWRITGPFRRLVTWVSGDSNPAPQQPDVLVVNKEASFSAMPSDTNLESPAPPIEQPATSGRPTNFEHSEIDMKPINHVTELLQFQGSAFVDTSYQALLGRKPDADGMTYYLDRLRTGRGKSQVIVQLAKSAESKAFKPKLQGLEDLLVDFERENHWFWGLWHRGRQVERQVNLLELQLGELGEEMRQMRLELLGRMQRLESALHQAQDHVSGASLTAVPPIQESENAEVMPVLGANGSKHFKRIRQALGHQK